MPIGLGIGLNISMRGGLGGSGFSLTAPVATWVSGPEVAQATFDLDVDSGVVAGYKIWGESSLDNFATVLETVSAAIGAPDLIDFEITDFAFSPFADGLTYARFWVSDASDAQISPKSNIISETIATAVSRQTIIFSPIYGGIYLNENGTRQAPFGGVYLNEGAS